MRSSVSTFDAGTSRRPSHPYIYDLNETHDCPLLNWLSEFCWPICACLVRVDPKKLHTFCRRKVCGCRFLPVHTHCIAILLSGDGSQTFHAYDVRRPSTIDHCLACTARIFEFHEAFVRIDFFICFLRKATLDPHVKPDIRDQYSKATEIYKPEENIPYGTPDAS